jgi:hypothetical protein
LKIEHAHGADRECQDSPTDKGSSEREHNAVHDARPQNVSSRESALFAFFAAPSGSQLAFERGMPTHRGERRRTVNRFETRLGQAVDCVRGFALVSR